MTQPDLFAPPPPASDAKPERVDFWNLIARERGMPEGWMWFSLQTIDHRLPRAQAAASVTGAVCRERFKSGPRKGELNWSKRDKSTERTLIVTFADLDARIARWEEDTGRCSECFGAGVAFKHTCRRCKGSGSSRERGEG